MSLGTIEFIMLVQEFVIVTLTASNSLRWMIFAMDAIETPENK